MSSSGGIAVTSANGTLTVNVTGPNGAAPAVWSDDDLQNTLSLPATVSPGATQRIYFQSRGTYTLSVKDGSTEIAGPNGNTLAVTVAPGEVSRYVYDTTYPVRTTDGAIIKSGGNASYAPLGSGTKLAKSAAWVRPNTMVAIGDSKVANNRALSGTRNTYGSFYYNSSRGPLIYALAKLRQRVQVLNWAGVPGNKTSDVLARWATDVTPFAPGYVFIEIGVNDVLTGVSAATIQANWQTMMDNCDAIGALPIFVTITPKSSSSYTSAQRAVCAQANRWLREQGRSRANLVVIDAHRVVADGTSADDWINKATAQYTADGTHYGTWGSFRVGANIYAALDPIIPKADVLAGGSGDDASDGSNLNLLSNSGLTGSGGTLANGATGTVPTGFQVKSYDNAALAGSAAASLVSRTDQGGNWLQVATTTTASNIRIYAQRTIDGTNLSVGDTIAAICEFDHDSDIAGLTLLRFTCAVFNASFQNATVYDMNYVNDNGWPGAENDLKKTILQTPPLTIPSGATTAYIALDATLTGTIRIGNPELRKNPTWA